MGICLSLLNNGNYNVNVDPLPDASGVCPTPSVAVAVSVAEYQEYILIKTGDIGGITSGDALYTFSWGFGAVMFFWFLGWSVVVGIEAIRKI